MSGGGGTSDSVYLRRVLNSLFSNCFFYGTSRANVYVDASSLGSGGITFNACRAETGQAADYFIQWAGGTTCSYFSIINCGLSVDTKVLYSTDTKIQNLRYIGSSDPSDVGSTLYQVQYSDIDMGIYKLTVSNTVTNSTIKGFPTKLSLTGLSDTIITNIVTGGIIGDENVARTATADGTGAGLIDAWTSFVTITSDDATKQITLPAPVVSKRIVLVTPATGCELICTGAGVKINDVICGAT
ncbi:unnamed protein product, partial [marine sediment metagenome]